MTREQAFSDLRTLAGTIYPIKDDHDESTCSNHDPDHPPTAGQRSWGQSYSVTGISGVLTLTLFECGGYWVNTEMSDLDLGWTLATVYQHSPLHARMVLSCQ